jgi:hypothetical protein
MLVLQPEILRVGDRRDRPVVFPGSQAGREGVAAASVVADDGAGLVQAAPQFAGQDGLGGVVGVEPGGGETVPDGGPRAVAAVRGSAGRLALFGDLVFSRGGSVFRSGLRLLGAGFGDRGALDGKERGGRHAGADVTVPGGPLADLVLGQADELFVELVELFSVTPRDVL